MGRGLDTGCALRDSEFLGTVRTVSQFFTVGFQVFVNGFHSVFLDHAFVFHVFLHNGSGVRQRRVGERVCHFDEHGAALVVHFDVAFFSFDHVLVVESLVASKVDILLEDRTRLFVVARQLLHDTDTFSEDFFFLLAVQFLFADLGSHRHEEHTHFVGGLEGPAFRSVGCRLGVLAHGLLENIDQLLDNLGLFLFLALQDNGLHLVVLVFTEVEGSFSRDTRVGILDLQTVLVVGFESLAVVFDSLFFFLKFHVGSGGTDVGSNQLFLIIVAIVLDEEVVFLSSKIPLLGVAVSHRDRERSVKSVGALRVITDEVLVTTNGFVSHLGFVIAQASAVQVTRSAFIFRIALVGDFVSHSGRLLVGNGVVSLGGRTDSHERHGILREVVRDEQVGLSGFAIFLFEVLLVALLQVGGLLMSVTRTYDTLDGQRRLGVLLGEDHEGFGSLGVVLVLFVSGTSFEHGLVGNVDKRVTFHESEISFSTLFVLATLNGLFCHLEEHIGDCLFDFLGHGIVASFLDLGVLLVEPFEFREGFVVGARFQEGLGKHTADKQNVLVLREVLLQFAEHAHGYLELLGVIVDDSCVVSKFCGFLVLSELGHILVHLGEVGLGFGGAVSLDSVVVVVLLLGGFASLVHHEHGVIRSFFLLQESFGAHRATAVTGGVGIDDPVEHLGSVSKLSHFLVDEGQVDMHLVFVPGRFLGVTLQECFVGLDGFGILLLAGFQVTFLGELGGTGVVVLRNVEHSATDCSFGVLHRFRILLVLLIPGGVAVIALHHGVAVLLGLFELLLDDEDFDHRDVGERSVNVVRVDGHQALERLHGFFVTVVVFVLHTDTVVHGILKRNLLVLQESFSFLHATTFKVRERGRHEVHSFCAQVCRVFTLVGTDDIFVVLDCCGFVLSNVVVRFCQVVHGKCSFLTRKGFEAGHLLVRLDSVAELAVHEVVFRNTEPSLRNETVVREVFNEAHTELVCLFVFTTGFLHGGSLVDHRRGLVFLRILVDVFEEVAQGLLVISLRKLVDVCALGRLVVAVGAPCHVFFVLGVLVEEVLFFELELVVAQLLESRGATLVLLTLTVVDLLFPLPNGIFHALFVEAARTASLFSLILQDLVGVGTLGLFGALRHGLALRGQLLSLINFVFTRIRRCKGRTYKRADDCTNK